MSDLTRAARRSASPLIPGFRSLFPGGPNLTVTTRRPVSRALASPAANGRLTLATRRSGPSTSGRSGARPAAEGRGRTPGSRSEMASLSLPGTQAPSGRPSPGQAQRRVVPVKPTPQAQRRVAGVKTCFGPGQMPAVWHRPGPAPGSSSEARPQARPRQKKISRRLFFFTFFAFFTPLTRRSVARGDADPWRPSGPTPGTVEGFPPPPPGRPTEASRGAGSARGPGPRPHPLPRAPLSGGPPPPGPRRGP